MSASPPSSDPSSMPDDAPPQKKKRTRTLTTPHQSEVLHALLAKSRFPTTAMREEVGRQIGLSARKVQIWFQNQRQKARRPQSESAPLMSPPQFGPFPTMSTPGPSYSSFPAGPSSARSAGSLDASPPLPGPGVPAWSHQRRHSSAEDRGALASPRIPPGISPLSPQSSDSDSRASTRGLAPQPVDTSPHFSRVLPPINLEPRSGTELGASATSPFPPSSSRSFMNAVRRLGHSATDPGTSPAARAIPPPFALQPQPQWDPHSFTPFTRPEFASWSLPSGSARQSFSPVGAHDRGTHDHGGHFYTSREPRRSGQLDTPSRDEHLSTSASSSRASPSARGHARSDEPPGEA